MTNEVYPPGTPFAEAVDAVRLGERDADEAADALLHMLTDKELLWLLDGDKTMIGSIVGGARTRTNFLAVTAGRIDRIGVPGLRFTDGPRGVGIAPSTSFPVAIARASTWDVDVERRVAAAIGAEARAHGANFWVDSASMSRPSPAGVAPRSPTAKIRYCSAKWVRRQPKAPSRG